MLLSSCILPKVREEVVNNFVIPTLMPRDQALVLRTTDLKLPDPVLLSNEQISRIQARSISWVIVDQTHIYWTEDDHPALLFQYPLAGGEAHSVATTQYPDGVLTVMRPIRTGDWLIFLDAQYPILRTPWKLRALNLKTGNQQILMESADGQTSLPLIDGDDAQLVWTMTVPSEEAMCTKTIIETYDLTRNYRRQIADTCAEDNYLWSLPSISGNEIAVEQDLPDKQDSASNVYLFDLGISTAVSLTSDGRSSVPDISESWIVWKHARRFEQGIKTGIYNRVSRQLMFVDLANLEPHLANDRWVYWTSDGTSPATAYDLETDHLFVAQHPTENEMIRSIWMAGSTIVWWRGVIAGPHRGDGWIEWIALPES